MGALKLEDIPHYIYEDYCRWEGKWELIFGVPYAMSPAPMIEYQTIRSKIARQLDEALEDCESCHAILPIDWKISDDTVVQPDNLIIVNPEDSIAEVYENRDGHFVKILDALKDSVSFDLGERTADFDFSRIWL